jgi:hypothetical protein
MGCGDNHAYSVSNFSVFLRIGVNISAFYTICSGGGFALL